MDFHHLSPADLPGAPQLNTWPVVSPVNASRRPSRDAAHHSGSGRMASPYPMGDFHLLFFASFPGALRVGSITSFWGGADDCRSTPMNGHLQSRSACLKRANKRLMHCHNEQLYSITSSARAKRVGSEGLRLRIRISGSSTAK